MPRDQRIDVDELLTADDAATRVLGALVIGVRAIAAGLLTGTVFMAFLLGLLLLASHL